MNEIRTFYEGDSERRSTRAEKTAQVRPDPDKQEPGILTLPDIARALPDAARALPGKARALPGKARTLPDAERVPLRIGLLRMVRKDREDE